MDRPVAQFPECIILYCNIDLAFNKEHEQSYYLADKTAIGYLTSCAFPGFGKTLKQDFFVDDPENPSIKRAIVGVIEYIYWKHSDGDRISITVRVSSYNRALLREIFTLAEQPIEPALEWVIYDLDEQEQRYFKKFFTDEKAVHFVVDPDQEVNIAEDWDDSRDYYLHEYDDGFDFRQFIPRSFKFEIALSIKKDADNGKLGWALSAHEKACYRELENSLALPQVRPVYTPVDVGCMIQDPYYACYISRTVAGSPIGHIVSLSFPALGTEFKADLQVSNPEHSQETVRVVSVLRNITWKGDSSEPIKIGGLISSYHRAQLMEMFQEYQTVDISIQWMLYDYDYDKQIYYKRFYTPEPIVGVCNFNCLNDDSYAEIKENRPVTFEYSLNFTPDNMAGHQQVALAFKAEGVRYVRTLQDTIPPEQLEKIYMSRDFLQCSVETALNASRPGGILEKVRRVGHLLAMSFAQVGIELPATVTVQNPLRPNEKTNVVGILKWTISPAYTDGAFILSGVVPAEAMERMQAALAKSNAPVEVSAQWALFEYDNEALCYFKSIYTCGSLAFVISQDKPFESRLSQLYNPICFDFSMCLMPKPGAQDQKIGFSYSLCGKQFVRSIG